MRCVPWRAESTAKVAMTVFFFFRSRGWAEWRPGLVPNLGLFALFNLFNEPWRIPDGLARWWRSERTDLIAFTWPTNTGTIFSVTVSSLKSATDC